MTMEHQFKRLLITSRGDINHFVQAIKSFRALTGYGLKESKEAIERIRDDGDVINIDVTGRNDEFIAEWVGSLRGAGLFVQYAYENNPIRDEIAEQVRQVISYSTLAGQYDIAKSLLTVLETFCPDGVEEETK